MIGLGSDKNGEGKRGNENETSIDGGEANLWQTHRHTDYMKVGLEFLIDYHT